MKKTSAFTWASADGRFGIEIKPAAVRLALVLCERAGTSETGGIMIGHYTASLDCAVVTELRGPSTDSRAGPTWFVRGAQGLADYLSKLWIRERRYYLGEWHFHPQASARPSPQDAAQMQDVARDERYRCPEPLLLIIGGSPPADHELAAFVALATKSLIPLDRPRERPPTK
jgi:hypothetical protein